MPTDFSTLTTILLLVASTGFHSTSALAGSHLPSMELHLGKISNGTITDGDGEFTLGLSGRFAAESIGPNINVSVEIWGWDNDVPNTEFSSCFLCSVDDEIDINVTTIGAAIMAVYPTTENLQFYAQAGLSYVMIDYELGASLLGFPGIAEEDSDTEFAIQYGAGMILLTGDNSIGLHFRHFDIESSSSKFAIENIDVGGDYIGVAIGWNF